MLKTIPYAVSPRREAEINASIADELAEIAAGRRAIETSASRVGLMQGIGRIEAACDRLTALARLVK